MQYIHRVVKWLECSFHRGGYFVTSPPLHWQLPSGPTCPTRSSLRTNLFNKKGDNDGEGGGDSKFKMKNGRVLQWPRCKVDGCHHQLMMGASSNKHQVEARRWRSPAPVPSCTGSINALPQRTSDASHNDADDGYKQQVEARRWRSPAAQAQ